MFKIIITSHGKMAEGMVDSLSFFMPDHDVEYLELDRNGIADFKERAESLLATKRSSPLLVFTDLFNGSPFNVFSELLAKSGYEYEIVAGINLPSVLEAAMLQTHSSIKDVLPSIKKASNAVIYSEVLRNTVLNDDDE